MRHKHTSLFLNALTIGILLTFTLITPGKAQFVDLGQDPCSTRWRQIKTDNFQIIYPDFFEDNAQYLANIYEKLYAHANSIIPDTIHVQSYWVTRPDGNQISPFSSWGATNELTLKPDITAIGGSVVSAYKNGSIAISSGTSMASPAIAGISVLVRQYLKSTTNLGGRELAAAVDKLMMSSASPVTDTDSGLPFSPRVQGAGLVDAGKAVSVGAYINVAC